jgi:hypothetical protein
VCKDDRFRLVLQRRPSRGLRPVCKQAPAKNGNSFIFWMIVGGVDGTRTRGLRRDRPAPTTAHRSRPRKIGVGSPARLPVDANRGRLFRNILQILANRDMSGRKRPRTASTSLAPAPRTQIAGSKPRRHGPVRNGRLSAGADEGDQVDTRRCSRHRSSARMDARPAGRAIAADLKRAS